ncbi:MAG: phosphoesterase [Thaumarchaeota archaeon]|nr:phosphoesterase [Nitrososphaerota archaeon]
MIEHIFVVMLENRSFDHLLGFSQIQGTDPSGRPTKLEGLTGRESNASPSGDAIAVSSPADFLMDYGPGHEFSDVKEQICGKGGTYSSPAPSPGQIDPNINNSGYVSNFSRYNRKNPESIMKCYSPTQLPVLTTLATEFAVCDHWFSSLPGPTWPNRFFIHAASSGGLDDSPSFSREFKSILYDGFKFDNGSIYDQFDNAKRDWMIYSGDEFPQALSIAGMRARLEKNFRPFNQFRHDVSDPKFSKSYVFMEPDYHAFTGKFRGGTSQHPNDDVTSGERLLKDIYESIRSSPHWEESLLIITYDEHGGFYDHVVPPTAIPPGDSVSSPGNNHNNFDFRQLGVRVPTLIISPLVAKGTIDHNTYDHTSVLATVEKLFNLGSLTKRDETAQTLNHLFKLQTPRTDAPMTLPDSAVSGYVHKERTGNSVAARLSELMSGLISLLRPKPVDPSLRGFHHVALLRDIQNSPVTEKEEIARRFLRHRTVHATKYMQRIRREAAAHKANG